MFEPLHRLQRAFTAHLRDPDANAAPAGLDPHRMRVYRELLYNNVEGILAGAYPMLREVLGTERWHALIGDYFARHRARTPLFAQMPRELIDYLEQERPPGPDDPPFLLELAHYEWVEMEVSTDPAEPSQVSADRKGDLLAAPPVLSPLVRVLAYRFPVHRIGPGFQPREPARDPTTLVVWRDTGDQVRFMQTNAATHLLLSLTAEHRGLSGQALLERVADRLPQIPREAILQGGAQTLAQLRRMDILLGTAPADGE